MAKLMYHLEGVRGRELKLYDTKAVITTKKTVGSLLTGNFTDGEKTIYLCDVVGVQIKESGMTIGYLQFETPSMQMNNADSNMFSENTFTYEEGVNGITRSKIREVYNYVTDRIEELKYGTSIITQTPNSISDEEKGSEKKGSFEYADFATAQRSGEMNIRCNNCHRIQFKNNKKCVQCGAAFTEIID